MKGNRSNGIEKDRCNLTICKVRNVSDIDMTSEFYFIGKTDEEISLVCKTEDTPSETIERDDGWKGFRIQGKLDFSLIGILSKLSGILADHQIGIFAFSTYNTDYILVKKAYSGTESSDTESGQRCRGHWPDLSLQSSIAFDDIHCSAESHLPL